MSAAREARIAETLKRALRDREVVVVTYRDHDGLLWSARLGVVNLHPVLVSGYIDGRRFGAFSISTLLDCRPLTDDEAMAAAEPPGATVPLRDQRIPDELTELFGFVCNGLTYDGVRQYVDVLRRQVRAHDLGPLADALRGLDQARRGADPFVVTGLGAHRVLASTLAVVDAARKLCAGLVEVENEEPR
jgi:hypothetical protein